jgi:fatty acid-binding protein DegV
MRIGIVVDSACDLPQDYIASYAALRQACATHAVEVLESVMSLTGMVNAGKGAITLGFADGPHTFT